MPLLLLLATSPGCYLMHGGPDEEPRRDACGAPLGQVCCTAGGRAVSAPADCPFACPAGSRLRDQDLCRPEMGPSVPDAGTAPPDAAVCPLVRADATCLESFAVEPGRPFTLPLTFDTCGCCVESACEAEVAQVDGRPTLRLTTTLCPDPCDCGVCVTPEVQCTVPALDEGMWDVVVNGAPAFTLPVIFDSGFAPPPPACATHAEPDRCSSAPIEPAGWRPREICVHEELREGGPLTVLTAATDCWGCGQLEGPCQARVEPRFTADLPPGGEIYLDPTSFATECDVDCPAMCTRHEQRCLVPPLTPGHFYRVWADGEPMLRFTAGESVRVCSDG